MILNEQQENKEDQQDSQYLETELDYKGYLISPDSKSQFKDINKDAGITNLSNHEINIALLRHRVIHYLELLGNMKEETGFVLAEAVINGKKQEVKVPTYTVRFVAEKAISSYQRDNAALFVTTKSRGGFFLRKLLEHHITKEQSYSLDKDYKKTMGMR